MAGGLKSKGTNIFVYVLLGLLILGLAGFGIGNFGGSVRSLGSVGETEIDVNDYARALQQELRNYQQQTGQALTMNDARTLGLDTAVLRQLVRRTALAEEAQRMGLSVGDEAVRGEIVTMPAFQNAAGSFDRDTYTFTLDRSGLKPAEFERMVRGDTTRSLLETAVTGGLPAADTYARTLADYAGETRDFEWTRLDGSHAPVPEPTEEELRAYHEANPDAFTRPQARRLAYIWATPRMLADSIEVTEEQIAALYTQREDEYRKPERRLAERLIFASREEADAARARLDGGEAEFEDLAAERSLTLEDIDLGEVAADDLAQPVAEALFAQTEPGIVGPLDTALGPALFRVNGVLAAQETPLEEVREELRRQIATDRARQDVSALIDRVDDLLASGATLEEIAQETPLTLGTIDLRPDSDDPIAGYESFRNAAELAQPGDFPQVEQLSDGGIFALRLEEVVPAAVQPFDEVRQQVAAAWTASELRKRLNARAEVLLPDLEQGASFDDLGLQAIAEEGLRRDARIADVPPTLVQKAFAMEEGKAATVDGVNGAIYLLRLQKITRPDPADARTAPLALLLSQQIRQQQQQDLLQLYGDAVQQDAGIQLNQSAINAVHAQFP